jgi:hypothetical protein
MSPPEWEGRSRLPPPGPAQELSITHHDADHDSVTQVAASRNLPLVHGVVRLDLDDLVDHGLIGLGRRRGLHLGSSCDGLHVRVDLGDGRDWTGATARGLASVGRYARSITIMGTDPRTVAWATSDLRNCLGIDPSRGAA